MIKAITFLLFASTCLGQLTTQSMQPFFNGATGTSTWSPTNVTAPSALLYWFDLVPTPSRNGARDALNAAGSIPADNGNALSWTNWLNYVNPAGGYWGNNINAGAEPKYHTLGGGNLGGQPVIMFTNGLSAYSVVQIPSLLLTNFTLMAVITNTSASSVRQSLFELSGNGFNYPFLDLDASALKMGSGATTVTGPTTILSQSYIVTWVNAGASSAIYTNGVLYKAAATTSIGVNYPATMGIAHIHGRDGGNPGLVGNTSPFAGGMSRVWLWTNVLSASDLLSAHTQCKTDFGFP